MKFNLAGLKSKKSKCFLVLDIGSETVKTLILKVRDSKIAILGTSLTCLDECGVFNGREFEADVIKKTLSETIGNIQKVTPEKPEFILVGLSANNFKGRIIWQSFKRMNSEEGIAPEAAFLKKPFTILQRKHILRQPIIDKKEEEEICQLALKRAKKEISEEFARTSGILPEDLYFTSLKILEMEIDGYQVPSLRGYDGEKIELKILATFLPTPYFKNLKNALYEINFKNKTFPKWEIVHESQGLISFSQNQEKDSIFLDIGGRVSQVFIIREKKLEGINEFEIGGRFFSEELSQALGVPEETARDLKERYSKKLLSLESNTLIKGFFSPVQKEWFRKLKIKIRENNQQKLLPSNIFIFGGGSLLPEFKEILKNGNWDDLPFADKPEVKFLYPKELKNIDDITPNLNTPQYTPSLLIYYGTCF
jgi:cell division ATPase FtsA